MARGRHRRSRVGEGSLALLFGANVVLGVAVTIKGATVPPMLSWLDVDASAVGVLFALVTIGGTVAVVLGGSLSDRWGARRVLYAACAVSLLAFAGFGHTTSFGWACVLMLAMGAGAGLLQGASNAHVIHVAGERAQGLMNTAQFFFGLGAIAGPAAAAALLASGVDWRVVYWLTGLLVLPLVALVASTGVRSGRACAEGAGSRQRGDWRAVLRQPTTWGLAAIGAMYITLELGISEWLAPLVQERHDATSSAAALLVALLWVGMAGGRLGVGLLLANVPARRVVATSSGLVPVALLGVLAAPSYLLLAILVVVLGFCLAPIFGTLLAWAGQLAPAAGGLVTGIVAAVSVLGATVLRFTMTVIVSQRTLYAGFVFFLALAAAMALAALVVGRHSRAAEARVPLKGALTA